MDPGELRGEDGARPHRRRALLAAGGVAAVAALLMLVARGRGSAEVRTVRVPAAPPPIVVADTLAPGETLALVLQEMGLPAREVADVVERVRPLVNPRRFRPGTAVQLTLNRSSRIPEGLFLDVDADRNLVLAPSGAGWTARLDSVPVTRDTVVVAGVVGSNLYDARLVGDTGALVEGERAEIAFALTRIFQWQVDFFRDLRSGDAFRIAVVRKVRPDGSVRSARVEGADLWNRGRHLTAIHLDVDDPEVEGYYARDGTSLQSMFLRAPLRYAVTSGFSRRRYHPVLDRVRAHRGIDYGAPRGTPVRATGGGVVTRAGRWGGYGRMVEIRHSGRFRTRYAHLSSIASGVRPGRRVAQGEVIGRVGATGLVTGAHLHYEFLVNGAQRNPATLDLPPGDPVPERYREAFETRRGQVLALLHRVSPAGSERFATDAAALTE